MGCFTGERLPTITEGDITKWSASMSFAAPKSGFEQLRIYRPLNDLCGRRPRAVAIGTRNAAHSLSTRCTTKVSQSAIFTSEVSRFQGLIIMPMLNELRRRLAHPYTVETGCQEGSEEMLVCDSRSGMRSPQVIDDKFGVALSREHDRRSTVSDVDGCNHYLPPKG